MNKNKNLFKMCIGCRDYGEIKHEGHLELYDRSCSIDYPILSSGEQCPCINCLVKTMCSMSCDEFSLFIILYNQELKNQKQYFDRLRMEKRLNYGE